jgi:N-acetylneuraminic acid mutarotase
MSGSAVLLATGEVLVIGGGDKYDYEIDFNTRCSLYDPSTRQWRRTASVKWGRFEAAAFLLQGGKVLVAGGTFASTGGTHTEIYDRATETWTEGLSLRHDHGDGAASAMLPSGEVLIAGGFTALKPNGADDTPDTWSVYSITAVEIYREP